MTVNTNNSKSNTKFPTATAIRQGKSKFTVAITNSSRQKQINHGKSKVTAGEKQIHHGKSRKQSRLTGYWIIKWIMGNFRPNDFNCKSIFEYHVHTYLYFFINCFSHLHVQTNNYIKVTKL